MIDVEHLVKSYGPVQAVRDVSFHVGQGEIVGFLGPNGAGKSTTLRILAGFLGMTRGRVSIAGYNIVKQPLKARAVLGYMPEATPLYTEMRVAEYLRFRAELKGVKGSERRARVEQAMSEACVTDMAEALIGTLSKGYRQRVGLADALVARPSILILDEPTAGLDPNQIREVRTLIKQLGQNHTILLSTHILSEVESTCTRALVIAQGKLVGEGTLDELRSRRRSTGARIVIRTSARHSIPSSPPPSRTPSLHDVGALVRTFSQVARVQEGAPTHEAIHTLEVMWKPNTSDTALALEETITRLVNEGFAVREASPVKASLDEVFAQLTEEAHVPSSESINPDKPHDDAPETAEGGHP